MPATDPRTKNLSQVITHGWPTRIEEVRAGIQKYWTFRELLVIQEGSEATLRKAKDAVYWPKMADQSPICEEDSPAQPRDKLLVHDILKLPWTKAGMYMFRVKWKEYLIIVDNLTYIFYVAVLHNTMAATVVHATKQQFVKHGIR